MGFLRRVLSGLDDQPSAAWYEISRGGYFAVAGVLHHTDEIARVYPLRRAGHEPVTEDIFATLQREPQNRHDPNAVAVLLDGHMAGYIPKENAPAWSRYWHASKPTATKPGSTHGSGSAATATT